MDQKKNINSEVEIDLLQLLSAVLKKWWLVVILSLLLASAGFAFSFFTYTPVYTSTATFVVSNKEEIDTSQITASDLTASSTLANTFKYILLSDEAITSIIDKYKLNVTSAELEKHITITPVSNTNILEMSVDTTDAQLSANIAQEIIEFYPDVLERTLKTASLEVLNPPRAANEPDAYNGNILYPLIGLLLGITLAVFIIFLTEYFRDTMKAASDITGKTDLNIIAAVPSVIKGKSKKTPKGLLITNKDNGFSFVETYKALRTKVENISTKKGFKSFVVSSALENEGKTTVIVNLALALAQNGKTVLLIDADLRKPNVHNLLGLKDKIEGKGLVDVLSDDAPLMEVIMRYENTNIYFLPTLSGVSNSSELLAKSKMGELISAATEKFDFVLVDTAPAILVTDAAVLTSYTDAAILVIRQDFAPASDVITAASNLSENKAELVGCVFNNVKNNSIGYGSYGNRYGRYGKYGNYGSYGK